MIINVVTCGTWIKMQSKYRVLQAGEVGEGEPNRIDMQS
jgi:hypothetical protein